MSALMPEHHHAARAVVQLLTAARTVKNVAGYVDDFIVRLSGHVVAALNGEYTAGQLAYHMRGLIRRNAEDVYLEGMRDGGIADPEGEIEADERAEIAAWIDSQLEHVDGFVAATLEVAALPAGQRRAQQRAILDRVGLWGGSLRDLGSAGKASALANMPCTWRLGATEEHCTTCARLNGKRHRLKWFTSRGYYPQQNGSETLECGGWRCECELRDDKGKRILPA